MYKYICHHAKDCGNKECCIAECIFNAELVNCIPINNDPVLIVQFPVAFHTVDIACISSDKYILLGRKVDEDKWRLPGGFVDPGEDAEEAAMRELKEETNINLNINHSHYIGSYVIDDKRYKDTPHSITTSLYLVDYVDGFSLASDDLAELKWVCLKDLRIDKEIMLNHRQLLWRVKEVLASEK